MKFFLALFASTLLAGGSTRVAAATFYPLTVTSGSVLTQFSNGNPADAKGVMEPLTQKGIFAIFKLDRATHELVYDFSSGLVEIIPKTSASAEKPIILANLASSAFPTSDIINVKAKSLLEFSSVGPDTAQPSSTAGTIFETLNGCVNLKVMGFNPSTFAFQKLVGTLASATTNPKMSGNAAILRLAFTISGKLFVQR